MIRGDLFGSQFLLRLHVHQHLRYYGQSPEHIILNPVSDVMPFPHRKLSPHDNVKICIEAEPHFSHEALVQAEHSRYLPGDASNPCHDTGVRCNVAKFKNSWSQLLPRAVQDHACAPQSGPAVRCFPYLVSDKSYRDSNKGEGNVIASLR